MSWIKKLEETYENCLSYIGKLDDSPRLLPIFYTTQNAQIEIVINGSGQFRRAQVVSRELSATDIPCTEESGGRTGSRPACHPLCDKLQYVAGDFVKFGGEVTSGFSKQPEEPHTKYLELLSKWCASPYAHPKIKAVYAYVSKSSIIEDLCRESILYEESGLLLKKWEDQSVKAPEIFGVMPNKNPPEEAFVRWKVEIPGDPQSDLSADLSVAKSWEEFYISTRQSTGFCYVTGDYRPLAKQHPAKLRHAADKAKLISANDGSGFTFRGRFNDSTGEQAVGVGCSVTQKAHNALRWLIARQGYRKGSQAIVAWSVPGKDIPDPFQNSLALLFSQNELLEMQSNKEAVTPSDAYVAQDFGIRLTKKLGGYKANLGEATGIIVLALDSATTGRMSIDYYRELASSEFLARIEKWHSQCSWHQNYGNKRCFLGAPAPSDIAEAAYGRHLNDKLLSTTVRSLVPCIIEGAPVPRHLVESCIRRASNREDSEEWEKTLGIACALYRYHKKIKEGVEYEMVLENERTTRDYLYGRLLAIAERLEGMALCLSGEDRDTNAARLMQRFAERPSETWRIIELALSPYRGRLRRQRAGFLSNMNSLLDEVMSSFRPGEFDSPDKLSAEFLLGYHCQRRSLRKKSPEEDSEAETKEINE